MADSDYGSGKPGWADTKAFRRAIIVALALAALAVVIAGFLQQFRKEHPHFNVEGMGAFFAVYGFVAFSFIVLAGQHLRKIVARKEDYYDERE